MATRRRQSASGATPSTSYPAKRSQVRRPFLHSGCAYLRSDACYEGSYSTLTVWQPAACWQASRTIGRESIMSTTTKEKPQVLPPQHQDRQPGTETAMHPHPEIESPMYKPAGK